MSYNISLLYYITNLHQKQESQYSYKMNQKYQGLNPHRICQLIPEKSNFLTIIQEKINLHFHQ